MLKRLVCMLSGHRVNRRRVHHRGGKHCSRCLRCGLPVTRGLKRWRKAS